MKIDILKLSTNFFHVVMLILTIIVLFKIAQLAFVAINNNFPIHSREPAEIIAVQKISEGESPGSLFTFPKNANSYVLFNHAFLSIFISPQDNYQDIAKFMRTSFWISSYLAAMLFALVCIREKVPLSLSCLVATIYLIHLTCLTNEMGSKPGGLGNLIFLLGMTLPYLSKFSKSSMYIGIFLLIIATFTKQLFMTGIPVLLTYYFLYISRNYAVFLTIYTILLFFSFLAFYEFFLPNSFGIFTNSHFRFSGGWKDMLTEKIIFIFSIFWPLIYLTIFMLFVNYFFYLLRSKNVGMLKNKSSHIQLLKQPIHYSIFCSFIIILIYYGYLVKNTAPGHYYYNYIFLFFLDLVTFSFFNQIL